jgi:hypothetical protein
MYETPVWNDHILYALREANAKPRFVPFYDILILDEVQDMTPNLYWLVCKYLTCAIELYGKVPRLVLLGDARQAIYEFRGADRRFCDHGENIFSSYSPDPWKPMKLDESFRLSHQNSRFINCMVGEGYIKATREGPLPKYMIANPFAVQSILNRIFPLIEQYGPENSAIIAPSVVQNRSLSLLSNTLSRKYGVPVADPIWEEGPLDPRTLNGKLTVGTYHQMKGSERDLVVVLGMDASYFTYAGRGLPQDQCPNAVYVALTRARQQLVVIQDHRQHAVPFISRDKLDDPTVCEFINLTKTVPLPPKQPEEIDPTQVYYPTKLTATSVARHIDECTISDLVERYLHIEEVTAPLPKSEHLDVADVVKTNAKKNHYEAVSDLNGIATMRSFEWEATSNLQPPYQAHGEMDDLNLVIPEDSKEKARWFAKDAAYRASLMTGYTSRLHQMRYHAFDWLDETLEETNARLSEQFRNPSALQFEKRVSIDLPLVDENTGRVIQNPKLEGCIDIVEPANESSKVPRLWEIKFTGSLTLEYAIQLAIYGYLSTFSQKGGAAIEFPQLSLFNVRTGAKWNITTDHEKVRLLLQGLLKAKYGYKALVSDTEFHQKCSDIRDALSTPPKVQPELIEIM